MTLLHAESRHLLTAVSNLLFSNPFLLDILVYEQEALGEDVACSIAMSCSQTGSYEEIARRLEIDRRAVKATINQELLSILASTRSVDGKRPR